MADGLNTTPDVCGEISATLEHTSKQYLFLSRSYRPRNTHNAHHLPKRDGHAYAFAKKSDPYIYLRKVNFGLTGWEGTWVSCC